MRETFEIEAPTSASDYASFLTFAARSPGRILQQLAIFGGVALWLTILAGSLAWMTAVFTSQDGTANATRAFLVSGWRNDPGAILPYIWLGCFALFVINMLVFVPQQCRAIARRIVSGYPEVHRDDPAGTIATRLRFDPRGLTSLSIDERVFVAWPLIQRIAETRTHLFLMTGRQTAFVISKKTLDPTRLADVRSLAERAAAAKSAL